MSEPLSETQANEPWPDGLLVIDKPSSCTSRDVVNWVQRQVRPLKVGHAGTLDPLAQGVLVVCIGRATRLVDHLHKFTKRYVGVFELGRQSDTDDCTGNLQTVENARIPSLQEIERAMPQFVGKYPQRPPGFSAVKVNGQRAYHLARAGKSLELNARTVQVASLQVVDYKYPMLTLDVVCHTGFYVRSLGRDLAERLGARAVMTALTRLSIGPFTRDKSLGANCLSAGSIRQALLPCLVALGDSPRIPVSEAEAAALAKGMFLAKEMELESLEAAAVDANGVLAAVLRRPHGQSPWRPSINFRTGPS